MSEKGQNLQQALQGIYNSSLVIYNEFELVFKLIGLLFAAYLSFKVGKLTVSEPVADKGRQISKMIAGLEKERGDIPKRIVQVTQTYTKFIALSIFLLLFVGFAVYLEQIKISFVTLAPGIFIPLLLYVIMSMKRASLRKKMEKFPQEEKKIRKNTHQLIEMLGPKVRDSIRPILCREKYLSRQREPANVCNKKQCKDMRDVLRQKYEGIKILAQAALTFQWCSICKKRNIFDELLRFEPKQMIKNEDQSQQQQVDDRINYLIQSLDEMFKWLQQASPCNCSKLYMQQIIKSKKHYNNIRKASNEKMRRIENSQHK